MFLIKTTVQFALAIILAFQQSYKWLYKTEDTSKIVIEKKCKKWKPYSSIAARYLYKLLDGGYTKTEFHLFKDIR